MTENIDRYQTGPAAAESTQNEEDSVSLLDLAIILAKRKKLVLGLPFLAALLAAAYTLYLPDVYTGTTKILPPQQNQSAAASVLNQVGAIAGMATGGFALKNSNDLYVGMLNSRTVADRLIERFELQKVYGARTLERTRKILAGNTVVTSGKDNLITVAVDDTDRKRAAELANGYVDELYKLTQTLAVTEASQRRLFFERQVAQSKENLARAEHAAKQALERGGLAQVEGQGRAILESTARLRGQITVKEIQLGAMRSFATENNPELVLVQRELDAMRQQLAKLEGSGGIRSESVSTRTGAGIDSFRLLRDVKYYETIQDLLGRQYELAKMDEARDASLIQVLDKAILPELKSKPRRTLICLFTAFVALVLAIVLALFMEALNNARSQPAQAERMSLLKYYLRSR